MTFQSIAVRTAAQPEATTVIIDDNPRDAMNKAYKRGKALNRRFEIQDVDAELMTAARAFAASYEGDFRYMLDMRQALETFGVLSAAQAKGVLNCLMAEARQKLAARREQAPTPAIEHEEVGTPIADGFYTVAFEDGTHRTFRVVTLDAAEATRKGFLQGSQYVSLLIGPDNGTDYARLGVMTLGIWAQRYGRVSSFSGRQATAEQISRVNEALRVLYSSDSESLTAYGKAYAVASGRCYVCGRMLTDPLSIELGIGPVCRDGGN